VASIWYKLCFLAVTIDINMYYIFKDFVFVFYFFGFVIRYSMYGECECIVLVM